MASIRGKARIGHGATYDACTVRRRVGYLAPLQHRQLTANTARSLFIREYDMKRADPFTVQPGIFGKALQSTCLRTVRRQT